MQLRSLVLFCTVLVCPCLAAAAHEGDPDPSFNLGHVRTVYVPTTIRPTAHQF